MKTESIQQYIIFSGDGHFSSVAAFMKNFKDKIVGIYAVNGTLSPQLKASATWYQLVFPQEQCDGAVRRAVLENLHWVEAQRGLIPTFSGTVRAVVSHYEFEEAKVKAEINSLIDAGYLSQNEKTLPSGDNIMALVADWALLEQHRLWNPVQQ